MKSYMKLSLGTMVALSIATVPTVFAYADEGVVTSDFSVKNQDGKIIKEFKSNEKILLNNEDEKSYNISVDGKEYKVDKENVLKTVKQEEESLSLVQDNTTLKLNPDLFGNTILHLNKGEVVYRIAETKEQNGFVKVKTSQSIEGWILKTALEQNVRNIPVQTNAFIMNDSENEQSLYYGDEVTVIGFEDNQYVLSNGDKTISVDKSTISFVKPPERKIEPKVYADTEIASFHNDTVADQVINKAFEYIGVPYVWGGTTPNGFDCSGFTQYVLASQRIHVPRTAEQQSYVGMTVERENLQKGDLIFFQTYKEAPSHVGFYISDGKFINASGDHVQVSNLNDSYWSQRYLWAKRMF